MKFPLGRLVATAGVVEAGHDMGELKKLLDRHVAGDWGDVCDEDKALNDADVTGGGRLLSSYMLGTVKVWIITEADRSATTFLYPEEY